MKPLLLFLGLVFSTMSHAIESTVTVPWQAFDSIYKEQIRQDLKKAEKPEPDPLMTLENIQYDLNVRGGQATGTITIAGSAVWVAGYTNSARAIVVSAGLMSR